MRFKVGDRVRIDCSTSELHGHEGTVWNVIRAPHRRWSAEVKPAGVKWWHSAYLIDVDGHGRYWKTAIGPGITYVHGVVGYAHFQLRPALRDPQAVEFIARLKRLSHEPIPAKALATK